MAKIASTKNVSPDIQYLNEKFITDLNASLQKMDHRHIRVCDYDDVVEGCTRNNPEHFKEFSHTHNYKKGDIQEFKTDTDKFIKNSYNIYKANNNQFSLEWIKKISERTGNTDDETGYTFDQFAQSIFNDYSTFYFLFLANVILNIDRYIEKTDYDFLINLFQEFESTDATGLYRIKNHTEIGKIITKWAEDERKNIDYKLGNTTIQNILKNKKNSTRTARTSIRARTERRVVPYGGSKKNRSKKYRSKKITKSKKSRRIKKYKCNII